MEKHWVIFGGDGTLHEVINGIGKHSIKLSYACGGSGNDIARGASLPFRYNDMIEHIFLKPTQHTYWLGKYDSRHFLNCVGFGFDALVAENTNKSIWKNRLNKVKLGKIVYVMQIIKQLFLYKPIDITLTIDDKTYEFPNCFLATINNHPYFGGGMKINPFAYNNAKKYHCIVVDNIAKWKVLFLFGTVFFGKHTKFREVTFLEGSNITMKSKQKVIFQVDGETIKARECMIHAERHSIDLVGVQAN